MSTEYFYGATGKGTAKRSAKPVRPGTNGKSVTGRIVKMLVGQSHGFIRMANKREVYFHRADLRDGTAFNDLRVGDVVKFELLEDTVSGARALRVEKRKSSR